MPQDGVGETGVMPRRWVIAPYFLVDDVVSTAAFYRDRLGFDYERIWGDPPVFCIVHRGGVMIMLSQIAGATVRPNRITDPSREAWDAYVWVEDADALHREFVEAGVTIARPQCDQPYGNRDFDVEDCNGYRIAFGHSIE